MRVEKRSEHRYKISKAKILYNKNEYKKIEKLSGTWPIVDISIRGIRFTKVDKLDWINLSVGDEVVLILISPYFEDIRIYGNVKWVLMEKTDYSDIGILFDEPLTNYCDFKSLINEHLLT